jgi:hypothetical protein
MQADGFGGAFEESPSRLISLYLCAFAALLGLDIETPGEVLRNPRPVPKPVPKLMS